MKLNSDTQLRDSLPADSNGYPLEIPYPVGGRPRAVRCMPNDFHQGEHVFLHDGEGEPAIGGREGTVKEGRLHVTLSGNGQPAWLGIKRLTKALDMSEKVDASDISDVLFPA